MTASDLDLMLQYAQGRSEEAFAELVSRHLDLVYSAALRQVRSRELAEEVAQSVFIDLWRNAAKLKPDTVLTAWLYQVTRRTAVDVIRRESRRQAREQLAAQLGQMNSNPSGWTQIEPLLDELMEGLEAGDRTVLLLRYFENKSLREVGQALGTSEDAAQKRVSRAVERLRETFTRRGVVAGTATIAALLSAHAVQSAPFGLSTTISAAAVLSGSGVAAGAVAATKAIAMTTTQKILITAALTAAAGLGVYETRQASKLHEQVETLRGQQTPLAAQLEQFRRERDEAVAKLAAVQQENDQLHQDTTELSKLRAEVSRMKAGELARTKAAATNDATESEVRSWMNRVSLLRERLAQTPESQIPELGLVNEQDWLNAAKGKLETEKDFRQALSNLRSAAENKFVAELRPAVSKYVKANNNQFPTDLSQLLPYFKSTIDPALLERWQIAPADQVPNVRMGGNWIITEKAPIDEEYDGCIVIGPNGYGSTTFKSVASTRDMSADQAILKPAFQAYLAATGGKDLVDPSQIVPYLTTAEQQAAYQRLQQKIAKQGDGE